MWRLIDFLRRFGNVMLFLFLELIALALIVTQNSPQKEISQNMFIEVSGRVGTIGESVTNYFHLDRENNLLQLENISLKGDLIKLRNELDVYKNCEPDSNTYSVIPDSLIPTSGFYFLPCKAINNSVDRSYNYITLDKGEIHGAKAGMGVMAPNGVVGRIIHVSKHYSLALSVLNKKFKLSAHLLNNDNVGVISWEAENPKRAVLTYIPQTSRIAIGDTVVTSAYSNIFPENFFIGTVSGFDTGNRDGFFRILVDLATDFRALGNLYLVGHSLKTEIDSLESLKVEK